MKRNRCFAIIIAGVILYSLLSCNGNDPVRIGVIISSTGSGAHMSETIEGIELAANEINEWGGIGSTPVELIIRDNETNPAKAVEIFNELEEKYKPDLYLCALSDIAAVLAPLAEENEVPLLCLATSTEEITRDKNWVFRFYVSSREEVPPAIYHLQKYNLDNVAVIYRDDLFGTSLLALFNKAALEEGIAVSGYPCAPGNTDISGSFDDLQMSDAVYIIGYSTDIPDILVQLRELEYGGKILAHSGASQTRVRTLDVSDGVLVAAPVIYNRNYSFAYELKRKFEDLYNRPLNHYGANGYEALKIFASLMEGNELSRKNIRDQLEGGFVSSGSLGTIKATQGSHGFDFDLVPATIQDGNLNYE